MTTSFDSAGDARGAHGRSPREWQLALDAALAARDHAALERVLCEMGAELRDEREIQRAHDHGPLLARLTEQARRLLRATPTALEALRAELEDERALWADFRERYRHAFVPTELQPFLDGCGVFIRPDADGVQYAGFDKYRGCSAGSLREGVLLFHCAARRGDAAAPPNFFATFDVPRGRLIVQRCYRTALPPGAGTSCLVELIGELVPEPRAIRELGFDNVQNAATYAAHVDSGAELPRLREGVTARGSPLGRLALRVLGGLGLRPGALRAALDRFGILDLRLPVA